MKIEPSKADALFTHFCNKFPLTVMFDLRHDKYPELISNGLPHGIRPWRIDVHTEMVKVLGKPMEFLRV